MALARSRWQSPHETVYGGGTRGNTGGNTLVVITGSIAHQIFSGGTAQRNPIHAGALGEMDDLGRVFGNSFISITDGGVENVYGDGYNDIFVLNGYEYNDGVPEEAHSNRTADEGEACVEIGGDTHMTASEQSKDASSAGADHPAACGESFHSAAGSTQIVISGDAKVESNEGTAYGCGGRCSDVVRGPVSAPIKCNAVMDNDKIKTGVIVVSQGRPSSLTSMGSASENRCHLDGAVSALPFEIKFENSEKYCQRGRVERLHGRSGGGHKTREVNKRLKKTHLGNVPPKQSGGAAFSIESGSAYEKNLVIGGTTKNCILGRCRTSDLDHDEVKSACALTFSGCGSADTKARRQLGLRAANSWQ